MKAGKAQFDRVAVRKAGNREIRTTNWVVANLWSTDRRPRNPVSLLWDPEGEGEQLSRDEIPQHASAIRRRRVMNIAAGLGHPGFPDGSSETGGRTVRISAQPTTPPQDPAPRDGDPVVVGTHGERRTATRRRADPLSNAEHEDAYVAAVITRFGVRPTLDLSDIDAARATQERARTEDELALIYGISSSALSKAATERTTWLSDTCIATPDGAVVFDLGEVEISAS